MIADAAGGQAAGWGGELLWTWGVIALVLVGAGLVRKRLARGVATGLFVGALSSLLIVNNLAGRLPAADISRAHLAVLCAALAALWYLASRWVERDRRRDTPTPEALRLRTPAGLATGGVAGVISGGLAWAVVCTSADEQTVALRALPALVAVVWIVGGIRLRSALAGYLGGAAVLLLVYRPAAAFVVDTWGTAVALTWGLSAAALGLSLLDVALDWQRRRAVWLTAPERLADPLPVRRRLHQPIPGCAALAALLSVFLAGAGGTPVAVALAALGVLGLGHRTRRTPTGEFGLLLVGVAIVLAVTAWLPAAPAWRLWGFALAAWYLCWLARFWEQQLHVGCPWTTAGRLVPAARRLGIAFAALASAWAVAWLAFNTPLRCTTAALACTALTLALLSRLLIHHALRWGDAAAATAACLVIVTAAVPVAAWAGNWGWNWSGELVLAAVTLVAATTIPRAARTPHVQVVWNALLGGVLPALVVIGTTVRGDWTTQTWPLVAAIVLASGACAWRARGDGLLRSPPVL